MIRIGDTVQIHARPQQVWTWLDELPAHYRDWHPAHADCHYVRGNHLAAGALLQVRERLHGTPHSLTLRADVVVPGRLLRYSGRGFRGAFILDPVRDGTSFTAEVELGIRLPVIGSLLDRVLRRWLAKRLSALRTHMREEGENLKRLLESPPRDPARPVLGR